MEPIKPEVKPQDPSLTRGTKREEIEKTLVIKTEMDAYISDLIKAGPQNAEEVPLYVKEYDSSDGRHRLSLPLELERKYGKKYAFRWVNKKKEWIDRALNIRQWLIVNRLLFADMPRHLFTANGTIENGDTILCFMPMANAERLRREPGDLSRQRVKDLPMDKGKNAGEDSPYYQPKSSQEERDGEVVNVGIQPDVEST